MAHTHLLGAHLGMDKTRDRILNRFYWPGVKKDVEDYCRVSSQKYPGGPRSHNTTLGQRQASPNGTFRFCNDFRRLNEVSDFDTYPMPRVHELIERLSPLPYHPRPHQGVLAGWQTAAHQNRSGEDGICNPGGTVRSSHSSLHRRYYHPQRQLGCPPPAAEGGPGGIEEGRSHSQTNQVPPGSGGDVVPGVPSQTGERPPPGEQGRNHPGLAPPQYKKSGEIVSRSGGVLPEVHRRLHHFGQSPK